MRRNEQVRMLIGLAIPGSGPAAGPMAAPPAAVSVARRRWLNGRGTLTGVRSWSRAHGLDRDHAAYWLALLVCCSLLGLVVGGYVGFMENATPHADPPYSFAQLAATDVGWAAKMRQDWLAAHPLESAAVGQHMRETHWQRLLEGAAGDSGLGGSDGRPSPTMLGGHFVRLSVPAAGRMPRHPNHRAERESDKPEF